MPSQKLKLADAMQTFLPADHWDRVWRSGFDAAGDALDDW
jgi:hypothetical protein